MGGGGGAGGGGVVSCGEVTLVLAEPFVVALLRGLGLGLQVGILPYLGDHIPFGVLLDTFRLPLHHLQTFRVYFLHDRLYTHR